MPLQNFVDNSIPTIKAAWLNAVDAFYFTLFNSATTAAQARTAISAASTGLVTASGLTQTTGKLLGRSTALTGAIEAITPGATLSLAAGSLVTSFAPLVNQLAGDVALNNTANYFAGPVVAQGTTGTFLAIGTVTITDTAAARIDAKLWDGTFVWATSQGTIAGANQFVSLTLVAIAVNPTGNLRIDVRDASNTSGTLDCNDGINGNVNSTLTVIRIA